MYGEQAVDDEMLQGTETILLVDDEGVIEDIHFEGAGCAISKASASLMTSLVKGKTAAQAERIFADFHELVTSAVDSPVDDAKVGKLAVFAGVREFPMRVKCATLAWHTMRSALHGDDAPITTE